MQSFSSFDEGMNHRALSMLHSPHSAMQKLGSVWRSAFRDEVPWWTAVELFVRLVMIAIFSLTITRIPMFTNLLLAFGILG